MLLILRGRNGDTRVNGGSKDVSRSIIVDIYNYGLLNPEQSKIKIKVILNDFAKNTLSSLGISYESTNGVDYLIDYTNIVRDPNHDFIFYRRRRESRLSETFNLIDYYVKDQLEQYIVRDTVFVNVMDTPYFDEIDIRFTSIDYIDPEILSRLNRTIKIDDEDLDIDETILNEWRLFLKNF